MMFVTKRGLSDACNVVGNQVDQVSDSVNVSFFVHVHCPADLCFSFKKNWSYGKLNFHHELS
jgi:hypothetical protein